MQQIYTEIPFKTPKNPNRILAIRWLRLFYSRNAISDNKMLLHELDNNIPYIATEPITEYCGPVVTGHTGILFDGEVEIGATYDMHSEVYRSSSEYKYNFDPKLNGTFPLPGGLAVQQIKSVHRYYKDTGYKFNRLFEVLLNGNRKPLALITKSPTEKTFEQLVKFQKIAYHNRRLKLPIIRL